MEKTENRVLGKDGKKNTRETLQEQARVSENGPRRKISLTPGNQLYPRKKPPQENAIDPSKQP